MPYTLGRLFDLGSDSVAIDAGPNPMLEAIQIRAEIDYTARRTTIVGQLSSVFEARPRFFTISMMLRM